LIENLKCSENSLSQFFVHHKYRTYLIGVEHRSLCWRGGSSCSSLVTAVKQDAVWLVLCWVVCGVALRMGRNYIRWIKEIW